MTQEPEEPLDEHGHRTRQLLRRGVLSIHILQVPLLFGLMLALLVLSASFFYALGEAVVTLDFLDRDKTILLVLDLLDMVFIANLIVMVMVSGYNAYAAAITRGDVTLTGTRGELLDAVLEAMRGEPMWLAKLNAGELATLSGAPTETHEQVVEAARSVSVLSAGSIEHVIATRGAAGAILVGPDAQISAQVFVHPGRIANTVGCGDALLAGVLHQYVRTGDWAKAMRQGVATATAAAVSREPGTLSVANVQEFWDAATIEPLEPSAAAG